MVLNEPSIFFSLISRTTLPSTQSAMAVEKPDTTVINQLAPAGIKISSTLIEERLADQPPCIAVCSDGKCSSSSGVTPDGRDTYSGNSILGKRTLSQREEVCVQPGSRSDGVNVGTHDNVMDEFDRLVSSSEVVFDFKETRNAVKVKGNTSLQLDTVPVMSHVETEQQDMLQALEQSLAIEVSC